LRAKRLAFPPCEKLEQKLFHRSWPFEKRVAALMPSAG